MNNTPIIKSIREHLLDIDNELGQSFIKQYPSNQDIILSHYFGDAHNFIYSSFYITTEYRKKVIAGIKNRHFDFDQYIIRLKDFISYALRSIDKGKFKNVLLCTRISDNSYKYSISNYIDEIIFDFEIIKTPESKDRDHSVYAQEYSILCTSIDVQSFTFSWIPYLKYIASFFFMVPPVALMMIAVVYYPPIRSLYHRFSSNLTILLLISVVFILWPFILKFIKFINFIIYEQINIKYSSTSRYKDYFDNKAIQDVNPLELKEYPLNLPIDDLLGFNILAAHIYYQSIYNQFTPSINKIIVIDAKRGMGKTSLINNLIQRINHNTYRHTNYGQQCKNIMLVRQINIVQLSSITFLQSFGQDKPNAQEENDALIRFLNFIADNLDSNSAKIIKMLLSTIETVKYKEITFKNFKDLCFNQNGTTLNTLKNRIKRLERKNLLIIEDLDRLNSIQLSCVTRFLWFIHDLPYKPNTYRKKSFFI